MDDDRDREEWANWSARTYAKAFQPRSVLRTGFLVSLAVAALLIALIAFAAKG